MTEQPELPLDPPTPAPAPPASPPPTVPGRNIALVLAPPPWWVRLMERLLAPWIEIKREPTVPPFVLDRPVCYVMENYGLSNALILDRACREAGLPSPFAPLPGDPLGRKRAYIAMSRRGGGAAQGTKKKSYSQGLSRLLMSHRISPDQDVQLVPVSIFVGRAPARQSGWFSVLFSEHWALVGRFRRLLAILLNGRDTVVQFSPSFPVRDILAEQLPHERTVRKTSRVLRAHFHKIRAAVIGPDLSTRRLLVDRVLDAEPVRKAITDQARRDNSEYLEAWKKAHRFAWEIAADYSNPVVKSLSFALTSFWNRIYDGVTIHHLDKLKQVAPGHEIVYVPCHRSHMDYLLLSYLLYQHGIVPPHIAAGDNLNLPVIGSVLRRGGAFFLRRSIRGNALYAAVFSEYVAQLVGEGFSLEYFIEGGRSRTGRLMAPKGGMIAMTVRAYLRAPRRPVVFQPVYIGYEKLIEGKSYLDELTGQPKQKETIWALLRGILEVLRSHYGKVTVSFGEPVRMDDVLAATDPEWRAQMQEEKPTWFSDVVDELAQRIQININRAADVNPINLLAIALLSTPKHAMAESDLLAQLALSKRLLAALPYSDRVTVTPMEPAEIIAYGEKIDVLTRRKHPLGDVLGLEGETAVLQSYFRNNVLHLFSAAAWIALCFQNNRRLSRVGMLRLGKTIYPFIQEELFLPWTEDEFAERLNATMDLFIAEGLLHVVNDDDGGILSRGPGQTDEVFRLRAIAHSLQQAFERYFIAITTLVKNGPRTLSAGELETLCHLAAQRLSLLYAPAAPEFFDKSLFRGFIGKLRDLKLVWICPNGKLDFDERLNNWEKDAKLVLSRELRHTITKISPEAVSKVASPGA
ncbi:MAG: glycerol-3-phosphate 1-O-acyltransferase PlsB [Gammaproteobacteria bacterium]|nr:glycerol-3-phosphate 1-O-acyltransferase PlsB [Gammaproteobacteria bacterium]